MAGEGLAAGLQGAVPLRGLRGQSKEGALQSHCVQRAGVQVHLPAPLGYQVTLVLGVQHEGQGAHPAAEK